MVFQGTRVALVCFLKQVSFRGTVSLVPRYGPSDFQNRLLELEFGLGLVERESSWLGRADWSRGSSLGRLHSLQPPWLPFYV